MKYTPSEVDFLTDRQAPVLAEAAHPESMFYWQAYHHLCSEGIDAMGRKPIPFRSVIKYAEWAGIECRVKQSRLVKMITGMDNAAREFLDRKAGS